MAKIDISEIDCDLLAIRRFGPELLHFGGHFTIPKPSNWMVYGVRRLLYKEGARWNTFWLVAGEAIEEAAISALMNAEI
jgi:hypothetical protein